VATLLGHGTHINVDEVRNEIRFAGNNLMWDYFEMFPDDMFVDDSRIFRGGLTFGEYVRQEAVRLAAVNVLIEEYANSLGVYVSGSEQLINNLVDFLLETPAEMAKFAPYMPQGETVDATTRANQIHARAIAGEDFDMLIAAYGEDPGMAWNPDGYTFTAWQMVEEFEQGTRDLEIGEISYPIRSQFGYHIILRVEPNPAEMHDGTDDWLGAKHILISDNTREPADLLREAIALHFEGVVARATIDFLPALSNVELE
jgi:hypothetical protein